MEIYETKKALVLEFGDVDVLIPIRKGLFVDHANLFNGLEIHCLTDTVYPKSTPYNIKIIIKESELSQIDFVGHNGFSVVGMKVTSRQARLFLAKLIELEMIR